MILFYHVIVSYLCKSLYYVVLNSILLDTIRIFIQIIRCNHINHFLLFLDFSLYGFIKQSRYK